MVTGSTENFSIYDALEFEYVALKLCLVRTVTLLIALYYTVLKGKTVTCRFSA